MYSYCDGFFVFVYLCFGFFVGEFVKDLYGFDQFFVGIFCGVYKVDCFDSVVDYKGKVMFDCLQIVDVEGWMCCVGFVGYWDFGDMDCEGNNRVFDVYGFDGFWM